MQDFPSCAAVLYDGQDPDDLERALSSALSMSLDELEEIGLRAKRHVEQFPWSLVAQKTQAVYEHVLCAEKGRLSSETFSK
jgi:glycosyltransferase involved in cell wall biosynthesis